MQFTEQLRNNLGGEAKTAAPRVLLNVAWGIWLVALSALMFTLLQQTGAVVTFMAAVALYVVVRPYDALIAIADSRFLWPFFAWAALSIIWSQVPELSARALAQLIFTAGAAAIMAQALAARSFITVLLGSCLVATIASVAYLGPELASQWSSGYSVQGIFLGSKNTFGYVEALVVLAGSYFILDRRRRLMLRVAMIPCICLAAALLLASKSATAIWVLAPTLMCLGAIYLVAKFGPRWRAIILLTVLAISVVCTAMIAPFMDSAFSTFLGASGKDATLTGRVVLWNWADKLMADRPIFGYGYEAFWIEGNRYADAMWRELGMTWRMGLHFHNQWYELAVELGYPGLVIGLVAFVVVFIEVLRWAVRAPTPESSFFLAFMVYTAIRSYVEVDLFIQYSIPFIVFITAYLYARKQRRETQATGRTVVTRGHPRQHFLRWAPLSR
jgi:exopolysaccharide production protein ExoQ